MKYWHARIRLRGGDHYGRWVPTGCADLEAAREYIHIYYKPDGFIVDWMQL